MTESLITKGFARFQEKNFKKMQKIFQKPLDKSKISAIIKVQKERNEQKMFGAFKNIWENKPMHD